jgi:hypothetical protein
VQKYQKKLKANLADCDNKKAQTISVWAKKANNILLFR